MNQKRSSTEFKHTPISPGANCWQIAIDHLEGPLKDGGWLDLLAQQLVTVAANEPDDKLYCATWFGPSIDFHTPTSSMWLVFSGSKRLKGMAATILQKLIPRTSIKTGLTDSSQDGWQGTLFIDVGQVWLPDDAEFWVSVEVLEEAPVEAGEPDQIEEPFDGENLIDGYKEGRARSLTANKSGLRFRAAKGDASVGSIQATIEKLFKLPEGSVKLTNPNKSFSRSDQSIRRLRERWE